MPPAKARKDRSDAILDVAIELAEEGGFDNVRQRDVAAQAGVALGTLYKRFRSKEMLLVATLEREANALERRMVESPAKGRTSPLRVTAFFDVATKTLCKKPNFARAVLRAMASGVPEIAANVAAYYGKLSGLLIAAMRGQGRLDDDAEPPTETEISLSYLLLQVWFAALVGWSAGLLTQQGVVDQAKTAATLLTRGAEKG